MKYISCLVLTLMMILSSFSNVAEARVKKKKKSTAKVARVSKKNKSSKGKFKKTSRRKRVKKSGIGPDLKALTTTSPYTENPDNGVNSIETKPGL